MRGKINAGLFAGRMLIFIMRVQQEKFEVRTNGKGTYEITDEAQAKIDKSGVRNGVVTIFVQHTSCSLTMMENAAPAARRDVERYFEQLVPEDADYEHDDEGPDDMPAHLRSALTQTQLSIPVQNGRMALGTWQGIFLFEHRLSTPERQIALHLIGE